MGDLGYATMVIVIIWAGIFFYLAGQDRRLKRLEAALLSQGEVEENITEPMED